MANVGKQSKSKINYAERRIEALNLRRTGMSYREIGRNLDVSGKRAYEMVSQAFAELKNDQNSTADEVRSLELERLDKMLESIWPKVEKGDVAALDRAVKIQERRAKLLGLDAPQSMDLRSGDGSMTPQVDTSKLSDAALQELMDARSGSGTK